MLHLTFVIPYLRRMRGSIFSVMPCSPRLSLAATLASLVVERESSDAEHNYSGQHQGSLQSGSPAVPASLSPLERCTLPPDAS